jgi:hypothetical protein
MKEFEGSLNCHKCQNKDSQKQECLVETILSKFVLPKTPTEGNLQMPLGSGLCMGSLGTMGEVRHPWHHLCALSLICDQQITCPSFYSLHSSRSSVDTDPVARVVSSMCQIHT